MTVQERITATHSILVFIYGFFCGVLVSSFFFIQPLISLFLLFVGIAIIIAEKIYSGDIGREVLFISLAFITFASGSLIYAIKDFHEPATPLLSGVVISEPEWRENTKRFVMLSDNGERVLVSTDLYSSIQYGNRVEVDGKWSTPGVIDDGIGRPFNYAAYLAKDDIYHTLSFAEVEIVSSGHANPVKAFLFKIKRALVGKMREILPEPKSSLLAGLVVAGKDAMPREILEEFRRAGIIHIVVLSGYNVAIIAVFITKFFEHLLMLLPGLVGRLSANGPRLAALASAIGIMLFVFMTGGEATVVRASFMALAVILAKSIGGNYSAPRALLAAAFLMVVINPKVLVFDPSFQLSFLATCGLIYLAPIFERWFRRLPEFLGFRAMFATTVATQTAVLPFLIWSMGDVSLVSLPANLLVLPFIPAAMAFGFAAAFLAFFSSLLALPISFIAHLILAWILGVSSVLGNLSFASVSVPQFSFLVVLGVYAVLIIFVRLRSFSPRPPSSN